MVYGSELWVENKGKKKKATGIRSEVPNEEIRRIMQAEETVLGRIEAIKLRWFRYVMRMPEERWPAIIHS
jgi:hypothetical protein